MATLRRALTFVGLALLALVVVAALTIGIVETPWFKDWLRGYAVREAERFLDAKVSIGSLRGSLFWDAELRDVTLQQNGAPVVAVDVVRVEFDIRTMLAEGLVFDRVVLQHPRIRASRESGRWNLATLVRPRPPSNESGGGRFAIRRIDLHDGSVDVADDASGDAVPARVEGIEGQVGLARRGHTFEVDVRSLRLATRAPDLEIASLEGVVRFVDAQLVLDRVAVATPLTRLWVDGTVEAYASAPVFGLRVRAEPLVFVEFAPFVPAFGRVPMSPALAIDLSGPLEALGIQLNASDPDAGTIQARLTADLSGEARRVEGEVALGSVDAAQVWSAAARSSLTGRFRLDLGFSSPLELVTMTGDVRVESGPARYDGYELSSLAADVAMKGGSITVDAVADAYGSRVTATGTAQERARGWHYDARGRVAGLDVRALPATLRVPPLDTRVTGAYEVAGEGAELRARLQFARSAFEGATIGEGSVAHVERQGTRLSYGFDGDLDALDVERVGRALKLEALATARFGTSLNGSLNVEGAGTSLESLALRGTTTLTASRWAGTSLPTLDVDFSLADRRVEADVRGRFDALDPSAFGAPARMSGRVAGAVDLHVAVDRLGEPLTLDSLAADGRVTLAPSTLGTIGIDVVRLAGRLAGGVATVDDGHVEAEGARVDLSGTVALGVIGESNAAVRVEVPDLTTLEQATGQPIRGRLVVEGVLAGNANAYRLAGSFSGGPLAYETTFDALQTDGTYTVTLPNADIGRVSVDASVDVQLPKIAGNELQGIVATLTYETDALGFDAQFEDRRRTVSTTGRLTLHPDHHEVHLDRLEVGLQAQTWALADPGDPVIQYDESQVTVRSLVLEHGDQRLRIDGTLATAPSIESQLLVGVEHVDLASLGTMLLLDTRELAGTLDAVALVGGTSEARQVSAEVAVGAGSVDGFTFDRVDAQVNVGRHETFVDARVQQTAAASLTAKGRMPNSAFGGDDTSDDPGFDLQVTSTPVDLALVDALTDAVENVGGTFQANVHVTGAGPAPRLDGNLSIQGGQFDVVSTGTSYRALTTTLRLAGDRIEIDAFQMSDDGGDALTIAGGLGLEGRRLGDVALRVSSEAFQVVDNDLADVSLQTDLTIDGTVQAPHVAGEIRIQSGLLELDRLLERLSPAYRTSVAPPGAEDGDRVTSSPLGRVTPADGARAPATDRQPPPSPEADASAAPAETDRPGLWSDVQFDVRVRIPDSFVVRGRDIRPPGAALALGDMNVTLGGDLTLDKTPGGELVLLGRVNTVRGTYDFQGRRFTILRDGQVVFEGADVVDPALDISAEREIAGILAKVDIGGHVRSPELSLSSDPPLDQGDILALIIFNQPANQLGEGQRASLAERAGSLASGFVVSPLTESLGRALDLDIFELDVAPGEGAGPSVTLGEQIGDRLFVRLRQQFGAQDVTELQLEYQLADFLRLQGALAEGAGRANRALSRRVERGGIDLVLFLRY